MTKPTPATKQEAQTPGKKKKSLSSIFNKAAATVLVGGALLFGFHQCTPDTIPPAPTPVVTTLPPAAEYCPTGVERFFHSLTQQGHDVSSNVHNAMNRAFSRTPRIAAQGVKDLGYYAFNGFDGVPKDANIALDLFQEAADAGNTQAKVDLLYAQYHGLGGVAQDKLAALEAVRTLPSMRAGTFNAHWSLDMPETLPSPGKDIATRAFDSKAILKGIDFCAKR